MTASDGTQSEQGGTPAGEVVAGSGSGVAVVFSAVSKTYRTGAGLPVRALAEVTLDIPAGQAVAVLGRSGSGKSTLLHLAGAMDVPDSGQLMVGGRDLGALSDAQRTVYRRGIGFVFQRFHLLPALTACDNVAAPLLPFRTGFDKRERAGQLLAAVGLEGREHDLPSKLSGGQQQRVAIARALIGSPQLLLADEPTGNLDSDTGAEVLDLLFGLHRDRGLTLLLGTHDPSVAARCQRNIEVRDGQVIRDQVVQPRVAESQL
ncbi:MAG: ABC transporter ATP-binding protein [Candidatus Dormiibacterota bacterium]